MRQPFAPRETLRSSLRTLERLSRNWLVLPLLFVTACGGSTIADSTWGSTGLPDRVLPPPPWYQAWATEQAKLNPDPVQLATVRAEKLIWEARSAGGSADVLIADSDNATVAKVGEMAMATIGYEQIMRLAEQKGWVEWVPVEQAQSVVDKRFIAQQLSPQLPTPSPGGRPPPLAKPPRLAKPPNASTIVKVTFTRVLTKAAPAAFVASQADTPAPGYGDALAVGIIAVALVAAGAISVYDIITAPADEPTTAAPVPASVTQPNASPAPPVATPRKYPNQTCEDAEMARLEKEMHTLCDGGFAATCGGSSTIIQKKLPEIPCSAIKLSIQQRQACVAARWEVQNKCFGGKPDDKHKKPIDDHQRGLDYCEALKLINCAKGHSMAGK